MNNNEAIEKAEKFILKNNIQDEDAIQDIYLTALSNKDSTNFSNALCKKWIQIQTNSKDDNTVPIHCINITVPDTNTNTIDKVNSEIILERFYELYGNNINTGIALYYILNDDTMRQTIEDAYNDGLVGDNKSFQEIRNSINNGIRFLRNPKLLKLLKDLS